MKSQALNTERPLNQETEQADDDLEDKMFDNFGADFKLKAKVEHIEDNNTEEPTILEQANGKIYSISEDE